MTCKPLGRGTLALLAGVMMAALALSGGLGGVLWAGEVIVLPPPDLTVGKNLMQSIQDRKSNRVFSPKPLSQQQLSSIMWAAAGVNRRTTEGKMGRTTPSSHNDQAIDVYAFTKDGVYKYDPFGHKLEKVISGDYRSKAGVQSYVVTAPLNLVFVADLSRVSGETERDRLMFVSMDVGHMSENVYLYSAASELNAICRNSIDKEVIRQLLWLGENYEPLLGMTIGYP